MSCTENEIIDDGNISDEEFERIYLPFHENFDEYMIRVVIPEAVAFYIANVYSRGCLDKCKLYNHINSAVDIFNCRCNMNKLIPKVKEILKIKYNLVVKNSNPLRLKRYN